MKKTMKMISLALMLCCLFFIASCTVESDHVHKYVETVVPPTCTEQGYTLHACECGRSYKDHYIDPLDTAHTFADTMTYDENGHWYAATCEHTSEKKDYAAHIFTDVVTAPTCTEQGYTTHTCACGYSFKDAYTDAKGHAFAETLTYDENGHWYAATCEHTTEKKDYAAHIFTDVVTAPTCTEQGYTTHTCACGYSFKDTYTDAKGHTFADALTYDENGHWYAATCEHTSEKKDYAAHTFTDAVTAPTCTEQGDTTHTCACG